MAPALEFPWDHQQGHALARAFMDGNATVAGFKLAIIDCHVVCSRSLDVLERFRLKRSRLSRSIHLFYAHLFRNPLRFSGCALIVRNLAAALLDVGSSGLGLEAAFDGAFCGHGLLAWRRRWFGSFGNKRDHPFARVLAVTLTGAETIGLDQNISVLGTFLSGKRRAVTGYLPAGLLSRRESAAARQSKPC